jgi:translation initiation factor 6 (eIF-6)
MKKLIEYIKDKLYPSETIGYYKQLADTEKKLRKYSNEDTYENRMARLEIEVLQLKIALANKYNRK